MIQFIFFVLLLTFTSAEEEIKPNAHSRNIYNRLHERPIRPKR